MLLFLLAGCLQPLDDSPVGVFEFVWSDFDAMYGGFAQRDIDWDAAYDELAPLVDDTTTDDELFDVLTTLIARLDDGHVRLLAPDREMFDANRDYRERTMQGTFDIAVVEEHYLEGPIDHGAWDWYTYGVVDGDIPYLWLPGIDDNTWTIRTIADEHPDAPAFILDLRHNHGGAFTYALQGMARLAEHDTDVWQSRSRNGPAHTDFDEWMTWDVRAEAPFWDVPLIVLTDRETISAGERMLLALTAITDPTIIGVPTNGALATSIMRQAPNQWMYQLPVQEVRAMDGTVHEGVGIPVDIELLDDPDDVARGVDAVLEAAIAYARR